ncbi:MAG: c-type cytochrome [Brevirhabdus sp.]
MKNLFALTALTAGLAMGQAAWAEGDAEKGAKVYKKCKSCHAIGDGAKNKTGPQLNNILNAPMGAVDGFKYSKIFKTLNETPGMVWNEENLDAFLAAPKKFAKGTKMSFSGLKKERDRANVIAYLAAFSEGSEVKVEAQNEALAPDEYINAAGDPDYGEYLAGECLGCHKVNANQGGIPPINGFKRDVFITALWGYKGGDRENPVMRQIAGQLGPEEMAALAEYYATISH